MMIIDINRQRTLAKLPVATLVQYITSNNRVLIVTTLLYNLCDDYGIEASFNAVPIAHRSQDQLKQLLEVQICSHKFYAP